MFLVFHYAPGEPEENGFGDWDYFTLLFSA